MTTHPERDVNVDTNVMKIKLLVVEISQKKTQMSVMALEKKAGIYRNHEGTTFCLYESCYYHNFTICLKVKY